MTDIFPELKKFEIYEMGIAKTESVNYYLYKGRLYHERFFTDKIKWELPDNWKIEFNDNVLEYQKQDFLKWFNRYLNNIISGYDLFSIYGVYKKKGFYTDNFSETVHTYQEIKDIPFDELYYHIIIHLLIYK